MRVTVTSQRNAIAGWRYLWCKAVHGYNLSVHCASCLRGSYESLFGKDMIVNAPIEFPGYGDGQVLYFCGVAVPYKWDRNFHLAGRVKEGAVVELPMSNGDVLRVEGLERITFDDAAARLMHPDRPKNFLTCRNFQFACQMQASR